MTVIDEPLLATFRTPGRCEWCGRSCRLREPAHVWARGHGAGRRLDIRINLVAMGSSLAFQCECHTLHHDGHRPLHCDLLALVAAREHSRQDWIEQAIHVLQRIPNRAALWQIKRACLGVPRGVMKLVAPILAREAA